MGLSGEACGVLRGLLKALAPASPVGRGGRARAWRSIWSSKTAASFRAGACAPAAAAPYYETSADVFKRKRN